MTDYTLKFPDEPTATAVLFTDGTPNRPNTDVVGVIVRDEVALPGWHVNIRCDDDHPELEPYRIYPNNPVRVWAGSGAPDIILPMEEILEPSVP